MEISELNRDEKGFLFELRVQNALDNLKAEYIANPRTFNEWKRNKGKGADIILFNAEVECKYLKGRVYPSWIYKSYIPRFQFNRRYAIVVTNYKWYIPKDCRKLLYEYHIKVMDIYEFIWFVVNHQHGEANKSYLLFNGYDSKIVNDNMVLYDKGYLISHLSDYG